MLILRFYLRLKIKLMKLGNNYLFVRNQVTRKSFLELAEELVQLLARKQVQ